MKRWIAILAVLALCAGVAVFAGCNKAELEDPTTAENTTDLGSADLYSGDDLNKDEKDGKTDGKSDGSAESSTEGTTVIYNNDNGSDNGSSTPALEISENPVVTITMEDGGVIRAELYYDKAPNTVLNFVSLAKSGYFAGKVFHRAVEGFMIQGGSPNGDGTSVGFPYSIKGEFAINGFTQNTLKHTRGVLSMARTNVNDSGSCQFFIMHGDSTFLDGQYAAFGMVISGMGVVDRIATSPTSNEMLLTPPVIKSVTVDTKGVDYPEPVTIPA